MKKLRLSDLSEPVRSFFNQMALDGPIMLVDDNDQLKCGITPYYEATAEEREQAWRRLEALQQKVGPRMQKKGITEDDIDRVLQKDD